MKGTMFGAPILLEVGMYLQLPKTKGRREMLKLFNQAILILVFWTNGWEPLLPSPRRYGGVDNRAAGEPDGKLTKLSPRLSVPKVGLEQRGRLADLDCT